MLGMGWFEIFVITIVALVVIGPDKLPEVARGVAKGLRYMQRFIADVRDTINLDEFDQQVRQEIDKNISPTNSTTPNSTKTTQPHPNFDGYDSDVDVDDDPYGPVAKPATPEKKVTGDR
jgi:sec-independent protein translocase protein TatB